ncbi:hypothetical protein LguiB_005185 [Lonicera macranthoides]
MRRKRTKLADMHPDLLKHIMLFVAKSFDGASSCARSFSICKLFKELLTDKETLKVVEFGNVKLYGMNGSFWKRNGLLARCAHAGNPMARNILMEYLLDLCKSSKAKIATGRILLADAGEYVRIIKNRACTRSMTRRIESLIEEIELLANAVDTDIHEIEELLDITK